MLSTGCAVNYYDVRSGTENVWGFGHLKMKAIPEGNVIPGSNYNTMAVLTSVQTLGLSVGAGQDYGGVTAGWDSRSRLLIADPNGASFCFLWPSNSLGMSWSGRNLFNLRIGTNLPPKVK